MGPESLPQAGPHSTTARSLGVEFMHNKDLFLDCPIQIPAMLQQAGFINVRSERRLVPLGRFSGQDGIDGSTDFSSAYVALKTLILRAGGYGHLQ